MTVTDAHEGHDVMTCDILNTFVQVMMPIQNTRQERAMMKIAGVPVELLAKINPWSMRRAEKHSVSKSCEQFVACHKPHWCGARSSTKSWKWKDSSSICMVHVLPIKSEKDHNTLFDFMWMI